MAMLQMGWDMMLGESSTTCASAQLISTCAQAHASAAVVNFSENCDQDLLPPYLDTLISKLLTLLQNGQRIVQVRHPMSVSGGLSTHVVSEDPLTGPSTCDPPAYVAVQGGLIESLACHLHGMAQRLRPPRSFCRVHHQRSRALSPTCARCPCQTYTPTMLIGIAS